MASAKIITINKTTFVDDDVPAFISDSRTHFCAIRGGDVHFSDSTATGLLQINSAEEAFSVRENHFEFIYAEHITIKGSHFRGIKKLLCGECKATNSTFEHCAYIFSLGVLKTINAYCGHHSSIACYQCTTKVRHNHTMNHG